MEIRVREIMAERGVRNKDLAARLGIKPLSMNMALSNGISSVANVVKIATALGVPVWEMFVEPEVKSSEMVTGQTDANRIQDVIREKGISQKDLAAKMGKTQATLSHILSKTSINLQSLEAIADGLEVPVWQLFISPEDYEREMERRGSINNEQLTINNEPFPINNSQLTINNEAQPAAINNAQSFARVDEVQAKTFAEDLFAQTEMEPVEEEWAKVLPDGTYTYGGKRIVLRGGEIWIK